MKAKLDEWSRSIKSLSSFAKCDCYNRDLFCSPKIMRRETNCKHCVSTCDGRDFRWRGGGMRREDEQRQDRKRRNDIDVALVRQREDRLLFFHAILVVSPSGDIRDNDTLVVRRCYRKFTSRLILRATNGLVASPISRMIIIIRGIRLCEQQRAVIEILYSRVIVSAENTVQRFNEEDFTHFPVEDRIASIRCADLPAICSLVDKIDNWQDLRFPARLKVKACNNLVRKLLRCFLRYALGES